jgi:hypothetical protein
MAYQPSEQVEVYKVNNGVLCRRHLILCLLDAALVGEG